MDPERYLTDRERLAAALRDLRQGAGLTGVEAARKSGMSQPKISKLETGRLLPVGRGRPNAARPLPGTTDRTEELLEVAARLHATIESNRTIVRRGAARCRPGSASLSTRPTTLRYFSPVVLPGLLQTAEYMRRVFSLELSGAELARTVPHGRNGSRSCTTRQDIHVRHHRGCPALGILPGRCHGSAGRAHRLPGHPGERRDRRDPLGRPAATPRCTATRS